LKSIKKRIACATLPLANLQGLPKVQAGLLFQAEKLIIRNQQLDNILLEIH
jgi:hypothetical protein